MTPRDEFVKQAEAFGLTHHQACVLWGEAHRHFTETLVPESLYRSEKERLQERLQSALDDVAELMGQSREQERHIQHHIEEKNGLRRSIEELADAASETRRKNANLVEENLRLHQQNAAALDLAREKHYLAAKERDEAREWVIRLFVLLDDICDTYKADCHDTTEAELRLSRLQWFADNRSLTDDQTPHR